MPTDTAVQRRDRALIATLFLPGSREGAAITLRIGHVDLANSCVHFDGKTVDTKFGKTFTTAFFPLGADVEAILRDWIAELKADHLFSARDTHQKFLAPLVSFGISASIFRPVLEPIRTDGSAVSHCFQLIVDFLFENPGFQKSQDNSGGKLSVVVEAGSYQQEVEEVFSVMNKRQPGLLGSLTFEGKDGRIALQMSDFLAYFIRRTDNNALRRNKGTKAGQRDLEFFSNAIGDILINRFFVPATPVKSPPAKPQS